MVSYGREVGMGFEPELTRELDSAEHQMLRQLQWCVHSGLVVASEHCVAKLG